MRNPDFASHLELAAASAALGNETAVDGLREGLGRVLGGLGRTLVEVSEVVTETVAQRNAEAPIGASLLLSPLPPGPPKQAATLAVDPLATGTAAAPPAAGGPRRRLLEGLRRSSTLNPKDDAVHAAVVDARMERQRRTSVSHPHRTRGSSSGGSLILAGLAAGANQAGAAPLSEAQAPPVRLSMSRARRSAPRDKHSAASVPAPVVLPEQRGSVAASARDGAAQVRAADAAKLLRSRSVILGGGSAAGKSGSAPTSPSQAASAPAPAPWQWSQLAPLPSQRDVLRGDERGAREEALSLNTVSALHAQDVQLVPPKHRRLSLGIFRSTQASRPPPLPLQRDQLYSGRGNAGSQFPAALTVDAPLADVSATQSSTRRLRVAYAPVLPPLPPTDKGGGRDSDHGSDSAWGDTASVASSLRRADAAPGAAAGDAGQLRGWARRKRDLVPWGGGVRLVPGGEEQETQRSDVEAVGPADARRSREADQPSGVGLRQRSVSDQSQGFLGEPQFENGVQDDAGQVDPQSEAPIAWAGPARAARLGRGVAGQRSPRRSPQQARAAGVKRAAERRGGRQAVSAAEGGSADPGGRLQPRRGQQQRPQPQRQHRSLPSGSAGHSRSEAERHRRGGRGSSESAGSRETDRSSGGGRRLGGASADSLERNSDGEGGRDTMRVGPDGTSRADAMSPPGEVAGAAIPSPLAALRNGAGVRFSSHRSRLRLDEWGSHLLRVARAPTAAVSLPPVAAGNEGRPRSASSHGILSVKPLTPPSSVPATLPPAMERAGDDMSLHPGVQDDGAAAAALPPNSAVDPRVNVSLDAPALPRTVPDAALVSAATSVAPDAAPTGNHSAPPSLGAAPPTFVTRQYVSSYAPSDALSFLQRASAAPQMAMQLLPAQRLLRAEPSVLRCHRLTITYYSDAAGVHRDPLLTATSGADTSGSIAAAATGTARSIAPPGAQGHGAPPTAAAANPVAATAALPSQRPSPPPGAPSSNRLSCRDGDATPVVKRLLRCDPPPECGVFIVIGAPRYEIEAGVGRARDAAFAAAAAAAALVAGAHSDRVEDGAVDVFDGGGAFGPEHLSAAASAATASATSVPPRTAAATLSSRSRASRTTAAAPAPATATTAPARVRRSESADAAAANSSTAREASSARSVAPALPAGVFRSLPPTLADFAGSGLLLERAAAAAALSSFPSSGSARGREGGVARVRGSRGSHDHDVRPRSRQVGQQSPRQRPHRTAADSGGTSSGGDRARSLVSRAFSGGAESAAFDWPLPPPASGGAGMTHKPSPVSTGADSDPVAVLLESLLAAAVVKQTPLQTEKLWSNWWPVQAATSALPPAVRLADLLSYSPFLVTSAGSQRGGAGRGHAAGKETSFPAGVAVDHAPLCLRLLPESLLHVSPYATAACYGPWHESAKNMLMRFLYPPSPVDRPLHSPVPGSSRAHGGFDLSLSFTEPLTLRVPFLSRYRDGGGGDAAAVHRDPGRIATELLGMYPATDVYGSGSVPDGASRQGAASAEHASSLSSAGHPPAPPSSPVPAFSAPIRYSADLDAAPSAFERLAMEGSRHALQTLAASGPISDAVSKGRALAWLTLDTGGCIDVQTRSPWLYASDGAESTSLVLVSGRVSLYASAFAGGRVPLLESAGLRTATQTRYPRAWRSCVQSSTTVDLWAPAVNVLATHADTLGDVSAAFSSAAFLSPAAIPWLSPPQVTALRSAAHFVPSESRLAVRAVHAVLRACANDGHVVDVPFDPTCNSLLTVLVPALSVTTASRRRAHEESHIDLAYTVTASGLPSPSGSVGDARLPRSTPVDDASCAAAPLSAAGVSWPPDAAAVLREAVDRSRASAAISAALSSKTSQLPRLGQALRSRGSAASARSIASRPPPPTPHSHNGGSEAVSGLGSIPEAPAAGEADGEMPALDGVEGATAAPRASPVRATASPPPQPLGRSTREPSAAAAAPPSSARAACATTAAALVGLPESVDELMIAYTPAAQTVIRRMPFACAMPIAAAACRAAPPVILAASASAAASLFSSASDVRSAASPNPSSSLIRAVLSLPPFHPRARVAAAARRDADPRRPLLPLATPWAEEVASLPSLSVSGTYRMASGEPPPTSALLRDKSALMSWWNEAVAASSSHRTTRGVPLAAADGGAGGACAPATASEGENDANAAFVQTVLRHPALLKRAAGGEDRVSVNINLDGLAVRLTPEALWAALNLRGNYAGAHQAPVTSQEWLRDGCRNLRSAARVTACDVSKSMAPAQHGAAGTVRVPLPESSASRAPLDGVELSLAGGTGRHGDVLLSPSMRNGGNVLRIAFALHIDKPELLLPLEDNGSESTASLDARPRGWGRLQGGGFPTAPAESADRPEEPCSATVGDIALRLATFDLAMDSSPNAMDLSLALSPLTAFVPTPACPPPRRGGRELPRATGTVAASAQPARPALHARGVRLHMFSQYAPLGLLLPLATRGAVTSAVAAHAVARTLGNLGGTPDNLLGQSDLSLPPPVTPSAWLGPAVCVRSHVAGEVGEVVASASVAQYASVAAAAAAFSRGVARAAAFPVGPLHRILPSASVDVEGEGDNSIIMSHRAPVGALRIRIHRAHVSTLVGLVRNNGRWPGGVASGMPQPHPLASVPLHALPPLLPHSRYVYEAAGGAQHSAADASGAVAASSLSDASLFPSVILPLPPGPPKLSSGGDLVLSGMPIPVKLPVQRDPASSTYPGGAVGGRWAAISGSALEHAHALASQAGPSWVLGWAAAAATPVAVMAHAVAAAVSSHWQAAQQRRAAALPPPPPIGGESISSSASEHARLTAISHPSVPHAHLTGLPSRPAVIVGHVATSAVAAGGVVSGGLLPTHHDLGDGKSTAQVPALPKPHAHASLSRSASAPVATPPLAKTPPGSVLQADPCCIGVFVVAGVGA